MIFVKIVIENLPIKIIKKKRLKSNLGFINENFTFNNLNR